MLNLSGRRVLITRASDDAALLARELENAGAEAVVFPCISIEFFVDDITRARVAGALKDANWVAFSSRRGVDAIVNLEVAVPADSAIAAVGESTRLRALEAFGRCDLVASGGTGKSLGEDLVESVAQQGQDATTTVVVPGAEAGKGDLEAELNAAGIGVNKVVVYRTLPIEPTTIRVNLNDLGVDTVILASPSATKGLLNQVKVPEETRIITIGPTTSESVQHAGLSVFAQATTPSMEAILEVVQ